MRPDARRGFFFFGLRFALSLEGQPCLPRAPYPKGCRFSFVVAGPATRFGSDTPVSYVGILPAFLFFSVTAVLFSL